MVVCEDVIVKTEVARVSRSYRVVCEALSLLSVDRRCLGLVGLLSRRRQSRRGPGTASFGLELGHRAGVNLRVLSWPTDGRITMVILLNLPRRLLSSRLLPLLAGDEALS